MAERKLRLKPKKIRLSSLPSGIEMIEDNIKTVLRRDSRWSKLAPSHFSAVYCPFYDIVFLVEDYYKMKKALESYGVELESRLSRRGYLQFKGDWVAYRCNTEKQDELNVEVDEEGYYKGPKKKLKLKRKKKLKLKKGA